MDVGSVRGVHLQRRVDQVFKALRISALGVLVLGVHDRHSYRTTLLRRLETLEGGVKVSKREQRAPKRLEVGYEHQDLKLEQHITYPNVNLLVQSHSGLDIK